MKATDFIALLQKEKLTFLTGVPCSYFESLLVCLNSKNSSLRHVIATSEGEAVGIAAGYHLATNEVPIVYLQNSGLGNAVNPLTSLMDKEVYSIPSILFLSWRGEPGQPDEPQHKKMGRIMLDLLKDMEIPYQFASHDIAETAQTLSALKMIAITEQKPVALIFRPKLIDKSAITTSGSPYGELMKREEILEILLEKITNSPIVTTTGKTSREVFDLREQRGQSHEYDFLTVGSMGCASGIGLGIAQSTEEQVFVIDGDGAALMKMGTLATIGHYKPKNLVHIVIDNGAYESTGGQPTTSTSLDWSNIFLGAGYGGVSIVKNRKQLTKLDMKNFTSLRAVVIHSRAGSRPDLGRPTSTPIQNKRDFMSFMAGL